MTQDFLSQDEVDALLKGVAGETDEPVAAEDTSAILKYDLGREERLVRGRMPTLDLINERFARHLQIGLFNYMHRTTEISVGPIRVQKYSDFIRNLVVPTNLNLVRFQPLRGIGLMVFDPNLVFLIVDNMFGGDGRFQTRVEGREFTATEQRIIQGMLTTVFAEFEKAWKPVYEIKLEYVRSEMNSQFANIAAPSEMVVAITYSLEFSGSSAEMHICMPYSMVEPIRDLLHSPMQSDRLVADSRWISTLTRQLQSADIELVAKLGYSQVTLGQILNMKIGDVIPLNIGETVMATAENVPVMDCRYGLQNGRYALRIERFLAPDEHDRK